MKKEKQLKVKSLKFAGEFARTNKLNYHGI